MRGVSILTNALPGFREVRAPLVTGYLWLLFGWLAFAPDLSPRPTSGATASLYDLAEYVGPLGVGIAASIAAYLLGAISQEAGQLVKHALTRSAVRIRNSEPDRRFERLSRVLDDTVARANRRIAGHQFPDELVAMFRESITERRSEAEQEILRDLELSETLLFEEQHELATEVGRLRAESELRLGVSLPLIAIVIFLGVTESDVWLLALVGAALIATQGALREQDAKHLIATAAVFERANLPSLDAFRGWIDGYTQGAADAAEALSEVLERVEPSATTTDSP